MSMKLVVRRVIREDGADMPLLLRLGGSHALKKHVGIFGWGVGLKDVTRGTGKGYQ